MLKLKSSQKLALLWVIGIPAFIALAFGWMMASSAVSDHARAAALTALNGHSGKHLNKGTLVIVDFTKPSQLKRLAVMNIENPLINAIEILRSTPSLGFDLGNRAKKDVINFTWVERARKSLDGFIS